MPKTKVLTAEEQKLYNELKKLSKRANQRIVRLEREFGKDTWATRHLKEKLEAETIQAWTSKGRVAVRKSMTAIQMKATIKATEQFLAGASTKTRVKKQKANSIKALKEQINIETDSMTDEEADALSEFFYDSSVNKITNYIPGSDIIALIEEAREIQNFNYKDFLSKAVSIQQYNRGKSIESLLKKIFKKYIFSFEQFKNLIETSSNNYTLTSFEDLALDLYMDKLISERQYNEIFNLVEIKRKSLND